MRRVLVAILAAGLALLSAPVPAAGQTVTITLSLVLSSDTATDITAIEEDGGQQTLQVKAVVASAPSSNVSVSVAIAAGTATVTTDYTISTTSTSVTINSGTTQGLSASFTVTPATDTITEQHETIQFTGTTTASGYDVSPSPVDLAITDQDRVIRLTAEGDPNTPKKTTLTRIENHQHEGFWVYVHGALGGVTNGVFTASTSNTYGSQLDTVFRFHNGTTNGIDGSASDLDPDEDWASDHHTGNTSNLGTIIISANGLGADALYNRQEETKNMSVAIANDNIAEGNEVFYAGLKTNPAGFTHRSVPITILDDDTQVGLTVDTDSGEGGNQTVLTEGDSGSGVEVSARFSGRTRFDGNGNSDPRSVGSSVIGSATVVRCRRRGRLPRVRGRRGRVI